MKFDILKPLSASGSGQRAIQEDCVFPAVGEGTIHDKLFIVADGVGGNGKGYAASECFCGAMPDYFFRNTCPDEPFSDEMLDEALLSTCQKMEKQASGSEGTRFAMLYMHRHGCTAAHVGNARIYHIRPASRTLLYRSADNDGVFVPDVSRMTRPAIAHITNVQYGDYFVLLTKGVHGEIADKRLIEIMCEPVNDQTKLMRMIKALSNARNNYTVTIVHVSGVMNEALDEKLVDDETRLMNALAASAVAPTKAVADKTRVVSQKTYAERKEGSAPASVKRTEDDMSKGAALQAGQQREDLPKPHRQDNGPVVAQDGRRGDVESRDRRPINEDYEDHEERKGRGFPIMTVTALAIVLLGVGCWFWFNSPSKDKEEEPAQEVKTDTVKKDTINIMKGDRPKPITGLEDPKAQENKTESKPEKPKEEETKPDTTSVPVVVSTPEPTTPVADTPSPAVEPPAATTQPQPAADPSTVTPRPVIPEDE